MTVSNSSIFVLCNADTSTATTSPPTSSVISLGNNASVNGNNETFVAYFFHSVEGYSKFGSYTGNGTSDGPFVYLGFRPAFLLTKRTDSGDNWRLTDSAREPFNDAAFAGLKANATDSEGDTGNRNFDYLSNGFKVRETDVDYRNKIDSSIQFLTLKYNNKTKNLIKIEGSTLERVELVKQSIFSWYLYQNQPP